MQFINILMLFGLLAVSIPIIIQLLTRKNVRRIAWGAWMFLVQTMKKRKRKMLLEDILLLACRCLALGLLALAFARPFVRPDSPVPWAVVMPVLLAGIVAMGISVALWRYPKWRLRMMVAGGVLFLLAIVAIVFERQLNLKRFGSGANKDVILVIDGSASMSMVHDGKSNFERGVEEAKKYVEQAPRNTSFAVVIGGPVPQVQNPVPISDRRVILNTLDRIRPSNGTMQIGPTLTASAVTLAAGHNAVKQIVIVGDGQSVGWQLDDVNRWKNVKRVFDSLKLSPIVTWRTLPLPTSIRNLAIESIRPSREVVGTDREVEIAVTLVNAGTEAVTPKGLTLEVEGRKLKAPGVRQLEPGASDTFTFRHRFAKAGGTVVTAHVDAQDELPADDKASYAIPVIGSLKALIVDGDPTASFLSRASTYVSLALRPELVKAAEASAPASAEGQANRFLLETTVEDLVTAGTRESFGNFAAVILMNVRTLPERTFATLARYVSCGGGLFVMPGLATDAAAFNAWTQDGAPVLPAQLGKWRENKSPLDAGSFRGCLNRFVAGGDLGAAAPTQVNEFGNWSSNAVAVAKLADGSPFLLSHPFGRGSVYLSAANFDAQSGLVSKRSFVPMMHELANALARPVAVSLNTPPSEGINLLLSSGIATGSGAGEPGLVGYYYPKAQFQGKPIVRVDKSVNFNWGNDSPMKGLPNDHFSVRWRGVIVFPKPGKWSFWWNVDDRFAMKIDGRELKRGDGRKFEANRPYAFYGEYEEDWGGAAVQLGWICMSGGEKVHGTVPHAAFMTKVAGGEGAGAVVEVTDPHGETFYGEIYGADAGLFLRLTRSVVPGVYTIASVPDFLRVPLAGAMTDDGKVFFSVSSDVGESTMEAITQDQLAWLSDYVMVTTAIKEEDVVKAIGGQSFGKEVWRILAFIAFLFLVAEPAISRWIARNRRTGDILDTEGSWIRT